MLSAIQCGLTLNAIREYGLMDNATRRGRHFREATADCSPPGVVDIRGLGLLLAVEFDSADRHDAVMEAAPRMGSSR